MSIELACDMSAQVLVVISRRDTPTDSMVQDHMMCVVQAISELTMYALYLQSSPAQEASLLVETEDSPDLCPVQQQIMIRLQKTWDTVLALENKEDSNAMLKHACPHTRFMNYREPMTMLQEESWCMSPRARDLLRSWHPPMSMSANVERIFNSLEDSCRRSSKNNTSCMSNLQCLAIRSLSKHVTSGSSGPSGIELLPHDWEGRQVRAIRSSVWKPESFSGGT